MLAEASAQLVNGALMVILLLYLRTKGYDDAQSAKFFAARFIGVLFISLPLGVYIKSRPLASYFKISSTTLPIFTLLAILFVELEISIGIYIAFLFWGISFSLAEIPKIPFVMRNSPINKLSNSISLAYSTWSFGALTSGLIIYSLSNAFPNIFDHKNCLIFISILSLIGAYFSFNIKNEAPPSSTQHQSIKEFFRSADYKRLSYALTPTFIIAIGAGMSVPFIPLYFNSTFGMKYDSFSGYSFLAYFLVLCLILFAPSIKNKFGLRYSIPISQTIAVSCLATMAVMEYYNDSFWALTIALIAYVLRQPLMNIAQPLTTEVIMKYVGKENHEIAASLMALIWNGSFVFSSLIFSFLRSMNTPFSAIFGITVLLYFVAIIWYQRLIVKTEMLP